MDFVSAIPDDPIAATIVILLILTLGGGGNALVLRWMKQRQELETAEQVDEADLTKTLRRLSKDMLADMKTELDSQRMWLNDTRRDLQTAREEASQLRTAFDQYKASSGADLASQKNRIKELERHVFEYQGRTMQLEAVLNAHNIPVPAWTMLPADIPRADD